MAYVVILHLSPQHESNLAELLQSKSSIPVTQVTESVDVTANHVYVIPPSKYLVMMDGSIKLTEVERSRGAHTSIDLFLRTLAETYGKNAIGILLSGTGADGTLGLGRIKEKGGIVIVQDPGEAEYPDMPRNAIDTGLVDLVLPVAEMSSKLLALRDGARRIQIGEAAEETPQEFDHDTLRELLMLLRLRTGNDFNNYKRPTLLRRIGRRMQVHGLGSMRAYLGFVREHPEEVTSLMRDLLITVTNFFRDHDAFEMLAKEVIPKIFAGKTPADQVRVWSAGCATGEEAYSLAMLLAEYAAKIAAPPRIQVFATDIDERAIAEARECRYPETITLDVSSERLHACFTHEGDRYRINKNLRELVLFAPHNVLRDPPFSKLDLISCRNLLIYLNRQMQERILQIFHFALRRDGYIFLGNSESAETGSSLFSPIDKKGHIYIRLAQVGTAQMPNLEMGQWQVRIPDVNAEHPNGAITAGKLHQDAVEELAPPSLLINENNEIIHMSTHAGRYLRLPGGEMTHDLLKLVNPDLRIELRSALLEAKSVATNAVTRLRRVQTEVEGEMSWLMLSVRRVTSEPARAQGFYLVMFDEGVDSSVLRSNEPRGASELEVVRELEQELQRTKDQLRVTVEQYETSTEELRASNEELQAINEELRSATEELETSKEELQSVNEELTTVNQEYREKIDEVGRANSDLQNLMASTDIATIFLDRSLQIKRYTPVAQQLFNITAADIGRPLEHFTNKLEYVLLSEDAEEVLRTLQSKEREVKSKGGNWYLARLIPYRTLEDRIDGIVLTFVEITRQIEIENRLRQQTAVLEEQTQILNLAPVFVMNSDHILLQWNRGCERLYGYSQQEAVGQSVHDLLKTEFPIRREQIESELKRSGYWEGEVIHTCSNGSRLIVATHWILHQRDLHKDQVIIQVNNDITARRLAEEALVEANRNKDRFLAMLAHELRGPLGAMSMGIALLEKAKVDAATGHARDIVDRQLRHLVRLVDDLLDVERLAQGKISLHRESVTLSSVIDTAVERLGPRIDRNDHDLKVQIPSEPLALNADPVRLAQVFANLLENAFKFTPPGGRIELTARRDANLAVVEVSDNGTGLAPDLLPKLFDLYTQGAVGINDQQGLGIGLSLARQLIEMHGGRISASSEGGGKGSTFVVSLPLAVAEEIKEASPDLGSKAAKSVSRQGKRVLVVEDNRDAADSLALLVNGQGHEARTAYNGGSALEAARDFKPEVAIVDIGLPGIDGFEVARRLRELLPKIVIVALSGWKIDTNESRAKHLDHFLTKPCDPKELEKLIALV